MRLVLLPLLLLATPLAAQDIACPPALPTAAPGFTLVPSPSRTSFPPRDAEQAGQRPFDRISVAEGPQSDIMAHRARTLAPHRRFTSGQTTFMPGQVWPPRIPATAEERWDLSADSPDGHFLVCHYAGTAAVLVRTLPAGFRECSLSRALTVRGEFASNGPRSGGCR